MSSLKTTVHTLQKKNEMREILCGVTVATEFNTNRFYPVTEYVFEDEVQVAIHCDLGNITVLNRMTGYGWREMETGFRAPDGKFWLASGFDVRDMNCSTFGEAITCIKENANMCRGD